MNGAISVDHVSSVTEQIGQNGTIDERPAGLRPGPSTDKYRPHRIGGSRPRPTLYGLPAVEPGQRPRWIETHRRSMLASDFLAAVIAAVVAYSVRLPDFHNAQFSQHYLPVTLILPVAWVLALACSDAYDSRIYGVGPEEFQRVARAFVMLMAAVGFGSYALQAGVARGYVVIALPMAAALSTLGRYAVRKRLHRARHRGDVRTAVVAVGDAESVADLARHMHAEQHVGMRVVGACIPRKQLADPNALAILAEADVTPLGDLDNVVMAVSRSRADTVAVTSSRSLSPHQLRELSWQMERIDADLVVSPGIIEVAGPRLHIRPVAGLPLLHVEKPEFAGMHRVIKGLADRAAALFGLLMLSPLLLGLWLLVRMTSTGPAFFHQTRVGKDGREFRIWKFRSMYVDAEARLADIEADNVHGEGPLFKMHSDPRVTRVGQVMRRYSLDELPQLINVVNGSMSLVGPRPPLPSEVAQYATNVRRRLLVRPGLTGLWQVSGRSDLSWEESVRLDLRYVENWSLSQDALILWKTASAVVRGAGAY